MVSAGRGVAPCTQGPGAAAGVNALADNAGSALQVTRLAVDQAGRAADFLRTRGGGVMDLLAHFWDRLAQTPPLLRDDVHLLLAGPGAAGTAGVDSASVLGAMLYVPKGHRADVFITDASAGRAFTSYLADWVQGQPRVERSEPPPAGAPETTVPAALALNYVTGEAISVQQMLPGLLELVHRKNAAKQSVNVMMRLPPDRPVRRCAKVRAARDGDEAVLNKWRRLYRKERGILFEADVDAWIDTGNVFVYELEGQVAAVAKFDLMLRAIVEIGGVFTFPDFRRRGIGAELVSELAGRIRESGKTPSLQVDTENEPALAMYRKGGWVEIGRLARVWLSNAP